MPQTKNTILPVLIILITAFFFSQSFNSCTSTKKEHSPVDTTKTQTELGRHLFYDRRLSINNTRSCATCHNPQFAFTDGYKRSLGAFADLHQRNTQALFNLSYLKYFTAADSTLHSPLEQMKNPLFSDHPVEMGVATNDTVILQRIKDDAAYKKMFAATGTAISWVSVKNAINAFINILYSGSAPYDKFIKGDSAALNMSAKAGMKLFFSPALKCASCHGGFNFSTPSMTNEKGDSLFYFNTGLYNTDGKGAYPYIDQGLFENTNQLRDMGAFRVPSLRNLKFTAPYFHDGSAASLNEVVDIYAAGGRKINTGIYKGNGISNPYKHPAINGFVLSATDKINLVQFLLSLSDSAFINNAAYQNPFSGDETRR